MGCNSLLRAGGNFLCGNRDLLSGIGWCGGGENRSASGNPARRCTNEATFQDFSEGVRPMSLTAGTFPKPLTPEEERLCLLRSTQGDLDARNVLIEHNLRLVSHIMKKYYAGESDQEDLISIGTIGLIKAVSTYRMDKNIRLATYASRCIENAILT